MFEIYFVCIYFRETLENDIALFRVSDPFVSTEAVLPAKLPIESYKPKSLFLHKIGWGLTQGKNVTQAGRLLKVCRNVQYLRPQSRFITKGESCYR